MSKFVVPKANRNPTPRQIGEFAYDNGLEASSNPYVRGTTESRAFGRGFANTKWLREKSQRAA